MIGRERMGGEKERENKTNYELGVDFRKRIIRVLIHAPAIRNWVHDERGGTPFFLL